MVELLVVLALVGVLVGIGVPVYGRVAESGRAAKCVGNLRQLGVALGVYLGEHNLTMPKLVSGRASVNEGGEAIDNTLNAYTQGQGVFECPSDRGEAKKSGTSYYWNVALNGQPATGLNFFQNYNQTEIPILADKAAYHPYLENKVNLLYADGHAEKTFTFQIKTQP